MISVVASVFFFSHELFFDAANEQKQLTKKLRQHQTSLRLAQQALKKLQQTRMTQTMSAEPPQLLQPLFILASLQTSGLKIELPLESNKLSMNFDHLSPWVSMLSDEIFQIDQDKNNKVSIRWPR
ncbi:MAG: hypothetical protein Rsou_0503 [Candidatus Ruthia sp. Asou_11_S2]|nr:hypothetical protein [Candidatus Ruthia sp. Asou_11_S2]